MDNDSVTNIDYDLTIIMSNYNQAKYIEKAIQSVLNQNVLFKYKLLITDDHSTQDDSISIIKRFVSEYNNIEAIFSNENGGYLKNIIRAKEITKTKYFCLLDADDYWTDDNWLQRAYDFLENHAEYVIYEANVKVVINDNEKDSKNNFLPSKFKNGTIRKEDMTAFKRIPITQTTGMFFRNVIFQDGVPLIMKEAVGTLAERSFEGDADRFIMHLKHGKAYYSKDVVGVYRQTSSGIWVRLKESEKLLIMARTFIDYYEYYESDIDYFSTRACEYLQRYYEAKKKEAALGVFDEKGILNSEEENLRAIYLFCYRYKDNIRKRKKNLKYILGEIVKIIRR